MWKRASEQGDVVRSTMADSAITMMDAPDAVWMTRAEAQELRDAGGMCGPVPEGGCLVVTLTAPIPHFSAPRGGLNFKRPGDEDG